MRGIVIKKNANLFSVESDGIIYSLNPSGKTKDGGIFVGDYVEFDENITKVFERKNKLIRPPMTNLDKMFITISPIPKPDFCLVDKLIIYCKINDIEPIIIINKIDKASREFCEQIKKEYSFFKVLEVSAKEKNISFLKDEIVGICAFAGQSAVGKSSLINAIFEIDKAATGEISKRVERGKQTTRIVELYKLGKGYIADTAGFSMLDLGFVSDIEANELSRYYPEFLKAIEKCKYRSCLHEHGECGVIASVKKGEIQERRYQNYLKILGEIKNKNKF